MQYLSESKDPTAKTVIFEDSAALIGIVLAGIGIYLADHYGAYWDGVASMAIGVVLAVVAFVLARISRGLLLGEAAIPKSVEAMRAAVVSHPNVMSVIDLLTMHMAPKQILVNAHVSLNEKLSGDEIVQTVAEIEEKLKEAEPKVDMIFLEVASGNDESPKEPHSKHFG